MSKETEKGHLVLNLNKNQDALLIGDNIRITYFRNKGKDQIRLRITAPKDILVIRENLLK